MKKLFNALTLLFIAMGIQAQERTVYVDFESSSFIESPSIPFDQPFAIQGEILKNIEYVEILIYNEGSKKILHTFFWNRSERNQSEQFKIEIPGILTSNTKYDFEIITFKIMTEAQKMELSDGLRKRIVFYLRNNLYYDGKNVNINKPEQVYNDLIILINEGFRYQRSKNSLEKPVLSRLVEDELRRYNDFNFKNILKKEEVVAEDSVAFRLIDNKVNSLTEIIMSEVAPYLESELVQQQRMVFITSVSTDKEPYSLPVNVGMYGWNKSVTLDNNSVNNINFTPGIGFTVPFSNKSSLFLNSRLFDSFGYSMGVLLSPITDVNGIEYITPAVKLPVYSGLGLRLFKVVRLNAGVLILAEKGLKDFSSLSALPTAGLSFELNLWMGVKK